MHRDSFSQGNYFQATVIILVCNYVFPYADGVQVVAMKSWNSLLFFFNGGVASCQHLEDGFHTDPNLLKFPVALWGTTRGPLGLATLPAGCRLRAPWRCPVYPWASWCQVTGLQPSCSRMPRRMAFTGPSDLKSLRCGSGEIHWKARFET